MEVFLQCHSRQIMIISIFQVKDDHIHQAGIWERFYNIRSVANMIATKQLLFIGNFYRDTFSDRPVKLMLITSCNNFKPEQVDCPQYQNKYTFVGNLCLLFKNYMKWIFILWMEPFRIESTRLVMKGIGINLFDAYYNQAKKY